MPDDYNPCAKEHKMFFRMPDDFYDIDKAGFYKPVCKDRDETPSA